MTAPTYSGTDDDRIHLITGKSKKTKEWRPAAPSWGELVEFMGTAERFKECGGYVPVSLRKTESLCGPEDARVPHVGYHRTQAGIRFCSLITLDVDAGDPDIAEKIVGLGYSGLLHPTYSHDPAAGVHKWRALIRPARSMLQDEKRIATRHLMRELGWHQFPDKTCASPEHFMYWPGRKDPSEFHLTVMTGDLLDVGMAVMLGDLQEPPRPSAVKPLAPGSPPTSTELEAAVERLDEWATVLSGLPDGTRTPYLFKVAAWLYQMVLAGCLDRDRVTARLAEAAALADYPGDEFAYHTNGAWNEAIKRGPAVPDSPGDFFDEWGTSPSVSAALTPRQATDLTRLRAYALRNPRRARWAAKRAISNGVPKDAVRTVFMNGSLK